jgi:small subunit ribosomal protein S4
VARYIGPTGRLSRREGVNLFLKGRRDLTDKAAIERRNYPPGQHGKGGRVKAKLQGYGLQLREKQKVKRLYGLLEKQFRRTFERASKEKGVVGETLLSMLERRLDNTVFRLGFGSTRSQARQFVAHGHIRVNGRRVDIPSYQVAAGDVIAVGPSLAKNVFVGEALDDVKGRGVPKWLELDAAGMSGKVLSMPAREDVNFPIQEQLIVELYSK